MNNHNDEQPRRILFFASSGAVPARGFPMSTGRPHRRLLAAAGVMLLSPSIVRKCMHHQRLAHIEVNRTPKGSSGMTSTPRRRDEHGFWVVIGLVMHVPLRRPDLFMNDMTGTWC
jgi:hypothetical protein